MPCILQGNEQLAIPHMRVPDMRWVDWKAIKAAGFEGAAFDKDNTLTLPFLEEVGRCRPPNLRVPGSFAVRLLPPRRTCCPTK